MTDTIENVGGRAIESHRADLEPIRVRILPDGRMDRENAAKYLGKKPKTLAMWQLQRKGPPSILVGGRRFYFKAGLDAFIRGEGT